MLVSETNCSMVKSSTRCGRQRQPKEQTSLETPPSRCIWPGSRYAGSRTSPKQLWGTRVSPSTVSDLNKKIYGTIEAWRNRPIEGEHPYVYLDGIVLKRSWAG